MSATMKDGDDFELKSRHPITDSTVRLSTISAMSLAYSAVLFRLSTTSLRLARAR
jgi:hypothetical protein